jgi:alpha,alpha-trehalase
MTFQPLQRHDGYLPLEDFGLIGDGSTAALVGRDGAVAWMCVPRFDSAPLFCGLLDSRRGGAFTVAPDQLLESRQFYEPDCGVLVTELRSATGMVRITDAMTLHTGADLLEDVAAARCELLRVITVIEGAVDLRVHIDPWNGAQAERRGDGLRIRAASRPDLDLQLSATAPLDGLRTRMRLAAPQTVTLTLRWDGGRYRHHPVEPDQALQATRTAWRNWAQHISYRGPQEALVRRSAITLKLLDHFANGAIVAAPTTSLPEAIGGPRNWDYRYTWIRDAAFSVYALRRIGLSKDADGFLGWALDAVGHEGHPRVLYDLEGKSPPEERIDPDLEGYRGSRPVRWGNAAVTQRQHDVYGEILDCAHQWAAHGGTIDARLWERLRRMGDAAAQEWRQADHGIWEVRVDGRPFTYSAAMCQVALDRATRLADRFGLPGRQAAWREEAERIRAAVLEEAWDPGQQALTEHLGPGGGLDASTLALPLRRVIRAEHPRMVATTAAISARLGAGDGLLYRYIPDVSPDGLEGHEGAFLLCSFWLVDNLAHQGRVAEAMDLFDSLCARANPLGLLPEQIDPGSGAFLGNYPQAFSHVGLISSAVNLARKVAHADGERHDVSASATASLPSPDG